MTLLFLSDIPWHGLHQRPQHLAARFAHTLPVLWIEPATLGHRMSFSPVRISDTLHTLSVPLIPHNARNAFIRLAAGLIWRVPGFRTLLRLWQRRIIDRGMRTLGMPATDLLIFMQNFQLIDLLRYFTPKSVTFDYIDNAFGFVAFPGYVHEDWRKALRRADVLTATSPVLQRLIREAVGREATLVPNGVEYARFAPDDTGERPPDLPPAGRPVVGYIGSVYAWFDFDLLDRVLRECGDVSVVLIGHGHPEIAGRLDALRTHPHFFFLGARPYTAIPAYVRCFSVGIIPFRKNMLTEAVNPVKLYEYSAAGVPTVATEFSPDLRGLDDRLLIARTPDEFLAHVRSALQQRNDPGLAEALRAFARRNDWDERATTLMHSMTSSTHLHPHGTTT